MSGENKINQEKCFAINQIEEIKRQIENLTEEKQEYEKRLKLINKIKYLNMKDSFKILEYLVSSIERKKYSIECIQIKLSLDSKSKHVKQSVIYNMFYLVSDDKKDIAKEEIIKRFNIKVVNNENIVLDSSTLDTSVVSNNYVQIGIFDDILSDNILFADRKKHINDDIEQVVIYDERYSYIIDYFNGIIQYKSNKDNFNIGYDEMKLLADKYISKYTHRNPKYLSDELNALERIDRIYEQSKSKISSSKQLNIQDSIQAIRYVVCNVEGNRYVINQKNIGDDFYLIYLTLDSENQNLNNNEIKLVICQKQIQTVEYKDNSIDELYEYYKTPQEHGICIIDKDKYGYILDFTDKLVSYRLNKFDYSLTSDDMKIVAQQFLRQLNSEKQKLEYKNE